MIGAIEKLKCVKIFQLFIDKNVNADSHTDVSIDFLREVSVTWFTILFNSGSETEEG